MLSIIIPSYKDPCLAKTINSLLTNAKGEIEIIVVLDGYFPTFDLPEDSRVIYIYQENTGMRGAINTGIAFANGEYLMRTDEHCMFAEGFDEALVKTIEDNWIVTPRRYKLNPVEWKVMEDGPIDYEKLVIRETPSRKFSGVEWKGRAKERRDIMVDETMWMQGSCWFMTRSWWDKVISELQSEGYGTHYQDTTEMIFKTWRAGGKLMVNKNTWFAHKHRSFNRTHHYSEQKAIPEWEYALNLWSGDYEKVRKEWGI
jgi:glycosyltransferase involved in cell wall biosynthesis